MTALGGARGWRGVAALGIAAFALTGLCMCGEGSHEIWRDAGAGGSVPLSDAPVADGDVDTGPAWDPVWHETEPKDWPTVGDVELPLCGDGCRIGLHIIDMHPSYYGHAFSQAGLAGVNTDERNLFFAGLNASRTNVLQGDKNAGEGFTEPFASGDFLSFLHTVPGNGSAGTKRVEVMNAITGETKVVYAFQKQSGDLGVSHTAMNDRYAFWDRAGQGIMGRNLETGELRVFGQECDRICATETGLLCFATPNLFIDQETGDATVIDSGGALQTDASCSPDRDRTIWVDYRDPPGPGSDLFSPRNGGEVYMKDFVSGEVRRLTHDSPLDPHAKAFPAVGTEIAAWKEVPVEWDPNPPTGQDVYASVWDLVVLDLVSGDKCRIHSELVEYFMFMSVHGRWVYGVGPTGLVIGIDIDHPAIGCEPY